MQAPTYARFGSLVLAGFIVAATASLAAQSDRPEIFGATLSADQATLFVEGEHLDQAVLVTLGGYALSGVQVDATGHHMVAQLPALIPATYKLAIATGNGNVDVNGKAADLDVTVVAVTEQVAGPAGATGADGIAGPAGPEGPAGPTGPAGPAGVAGARGATGPAGTPGSTGATGPMGPIGASGPAGGQGAPGAQGAQGATGPAGAAGPAGPAGAVGPEGAQGPAGADGAPGTTGAPGMAGVAGPAGPAGQDGAAGSEGAQGPEGAAGTDGREGPAGPAGPQGEPGLAGPAGPAGATGATGPAGPTGPAGTVTIRVAGWVRGSGAIKSGAGFTVARVLSAHGYYRLTIPATATGRPLIVTVTPSTLNVTARVVAYSKDAVDSSHIVDISIHSVSGGAMVDGDFLFIALEQS